MQFKAKTFNELTTDELYEILKVRAEIFVVEQNCIYQDLDDVDRRSLHLWGCGTDGLINCYLRMFEKEPGCVQIGRVLSQPHGQGYGGALLKEALLLLRSGSFKVDTGRIDPAAKRTNPAKGAEEANGTKDRMCVQRVFLEAQCYAAGFYAAEGFRICSEEFLEDGIPHVGMELSLKEDKAFE